MQNGGWSIDKEREICNRDPTRVYVPIGSWKPSTCSCSCCARNLFPPQPPASSAGKPAPNYFLGGRRSLHAVPMPIQASIFDPLMVQTPVQGQHRDLRMMPVMIEGALVAPLGPRETPQVLQNPPAVQLPVPHDTEHDSLTPRKEEVKDQAAQMARAPAGRPLEVVQIPERPETLERSQAVGQPPAEPPVRTPLTSKIVEIEISETKSEIQVGKAPAEPPVVRNTPKEVEKPQVGKSPAEPPRGVMQVPQGLISQGVEVVAVGRAPAENPVVVDTPEMLPKVGRPPAERPLIQIPESIIQKALDVGKPPAEPPVIKTPEIPRETVSSGITPELKDEELLLRARTPTPAFAGVPEGAQEEPLPLATDDVQTQEDLANEPFLDRTPAPQGSSSIAQPLKFTGPNDPRLQPQPIPVTDLDEPYLDRTPMPAPHPHIYKVQTPDHLKFEVVPEDPYEDRTPMPVPITPNTQILDVPKEPKTVGAPPPASPIIQTPKISSQIADLPGLPDQLLRDRTPSAQFNPDPAWVVYRNVPSDQAAPFKDRTPSPQGSSRVLPLVKDPAAAASAAAPLDGAEEVMLMAARTPSAPQYTGRPLGGGAKKSEGVRALKDPLADMMEEMRTRTPSAQQQQEESH